MIKAVLFDLDGTLLPMDQDQFVKYYMSLLAQTMVPHGYEPKKLIWAVWAGTDEMVKNDGSQTNETIFWQSFANILGKESLQDMAYFMDFYDNQFQKAVEACRPTPLAAETIQSIHAMGLQTILATNPIFPAAATLSRIRWAGLDAKDFPLITTYENSHFCKPNLNYYREILHSMHLSPEECVMVGNDVQEDMVAAELGIRVFLLSDCLIDRANSDLDAFPHGGFPELLTWLQSITV